MGQHCSSNVEYPAVHGRPKKKPVKRVNRRHEASTTDHVDDRRTSPPRGTGNPLTTPKSKETSKRRISDLSPKGGGNSTTSSAPLSDGTARACESSGRHSSLPVAESRLSSVQWVDVPAADEMGVVPSPFQVEPMAVVDLNDEPHTTSAVSPQRTSVEPEDTTAFMEAVPSSSVGTQQPKETSLTKEVGMMGTSHHDSASCGACRDYAANDAFGDCEDGHRTEADVPTLNRPFLREISTNGTTCRGITNFEHPSEQSVDRQMVIDSVQVVSHAMEGSVAISSCSVPELAPASNFRSQVPATANMLLLPHSDHHCPTPLSSTSGDQNLGDTSQYSTASISFGSIPRVSTVVASSAKKGTMMSDTNRLRRAGVVSRLERASVGDIQLLMEALRLWCCLWLTEAAAPSQSRVFSLLERLHHLFVENYALSPRAPLSSQHEAFLQMLRAMVHEPSHRSAQVMLQQHLSKIDPSRSSSSVMGMIPRHDPDEVLPGIFVGSYHAVVGKDILKTFRIEAVVSCVGDLFAAREGIDDLRRNVSMLHPNAAPMEPLRRGRRGPHAAGAIPMDDDEEEDPPNRYRRCGVEHCNIQMRDKTSYRVDQHFDLAVRFLREMYLEKRSSCLVVCGAGVSRAPTIAAAFLCDLFGIQVDHALAIIRSSRPQIRPNDAFLLHLLRCYSPQLLPPEET